jgi:hypothetical protein
MNRIYIKYTTQKGNICSNLEIWNNIKGITCEKLGKTFFGREADIMLEYFKNVTIKDNNKVMSYGLYIDGKELKDSDD